ncbi:anti-sigma factor [Mycetocola sp. 2940]|uniref:anti-sigma factor n=1 Tax=Mycetocola sp. 2940 TaxID=3156452 RepID=UPI0033937B00
MAHLDDDQLTLFAFGEADPNAEQREHLRTCSRCEAELVALSRLVSVGRSLGNEELVQPPDAVWRGIHSELGLSEEVREVPRKQQSAPEAAVRRDVGSPARRGAFRRRIPRRGAVVGIVAAASLVVGVIAGVVGASLFVRPAASRVVAEAELEPFPNWQASGTARVEEGSSGAQQMVIDLSAPDQGLREVWLIDPGTSGLISLGLLSGASGTFSLPDDVDLERYSVVDVSQEPDDGNPAHSGDSIVRGELRST